MVNEEKWTAVAIMARAEPASVRLDSVWWTPSMDACPNAFLRFST